MNVAQKRIIAVTVSIIFVALLCVAVLGGLFIAGNPYNGTVNNRGNSKPLNTVLSKAEATEDLKYIKDTIDQKHYSAKKTLPSAVSDTYEKIISQLPDSVSVGQLLRLSKQLSATLNDAHTSAYYLSNDNYFHNQKIRVDNNGKAEIFINDSWYELVKVNDVPMSQILSEAQSTFSYENNYWLYAQIEQAFISAESLTTLGISYNIQSVRFTYLDKSEKVIEAQFNNNTPSGEKEIPVSYTLDKSMSLGIFTLNQCIYDNNYKNELEEFFRAVKENNIKNIAIDLRKNGGGNSKVVDEFLKYLDIKEYKTFGVSVRNGVYDLKSKSKTVKNKQNKDLTFNGATYVLTSRQTFSSAMMFATILKDNAIAKIIGEPLGNSPTSYGDVLNFQLPNSKLIFQTTYKYFIRPNGDINEKTLTPDVNSETALQKLSEIIKAGGVS